jgi:hypothetical protein
MLFTKLKKKIFKITNIYPKFLDHIDSKDRKYKGLSKLVKICFGLPLDKRECMSNWSNNPLRLAQIKYAALDAFVLIQIHDHIQLKLKQFSVDFDFNEYNKKKETL